MYQNFTVKLADFTLTKFYGVPKHLKMINFSEIIFRKIFYGKTNRPLIYIATKFQIQPNSYYSFLLKINKNSYYKPKKTKHIKPH